MAANIANVYKGTKINTASPAELTLMLYDGAIKFCNIALLGFEQNDTEKINNYIKKTLNIITEFRSTLDFKYPTAKDFDMVYDYIYRQLVDANVKKDQSCLEEALDRIREMRDLWKDVMRQNHVYVGK